MKPTRPFLCALVVTLAASGATTNRIFHIGNSLTDGTLSQSKLTLFAQQRGNKYTFGKHLNWNSSLEEIWSYATPVGATQTPYGEYTNALPNYAWDAITLQTFFRSSATTGTLYLVTNDILRCRQFIECAQQKSTNVRAIMYGPHPPTVRFTGLSNGYSEYWLKPYNATNPTLTQTRAYYECLVTSVIAQVSAPVFYLPVGEVMYRIDQHLKSEGSYGGVTNMLQFYADGLHCNASGTYISACTFYSTIYRETPIGLPPIGIESNLAAIIQTTVWQVVATHPLAGIVPEPLTMGCVMVSIAYLGLSRNSR